MGEVHHLPRRRKPACPICGKPAVEKNRPFCSPRCHQVDLGRWLGDTYRIPTDDVPEEAELAAALTARDSDS
ncbi:MAG: DNA gyrase inhibitor YacG [Alphaproteobacteria bacterium]|nr:DNA gyrase inhibitor YacG [Alphaproteobacteria bacterium]MBU0795811.1 DNA gyrase inhibitor YacG [Alphaproteobacteria bacterium]MBU0886673.1 DNA gyrase inhibitor YacG [Alphaproteobacteria bacterium]MBU1814528.1 DNA gyrase inhibitor YacG [Alphaproteobacteria bacterium]MBU2092072.1 DNA gyrase inhibitor YacG [Alphaproteobacteria bacterium]